MSVSNADNGAGKRLILVSGSRRHRQLFDVLGVPFETLAIANAPPAVNATSDPAGYVASAAIDKAFAAAAGVRGDALLIATVTLVVMDGVVYGKPTDAYDAARMLRALRGRTHEVHTGLCLLSVADGLPVERTSVTAVTEVTLANIPDSFLGRYVRSDESLENAGAYSLQGKALTFIENVEGDYYSALGVPLALLRAALLPLYPQIQRLPAQPAIPTSSFGDYKVDMSRLWYAAATVAGLVVGPIAMTWLLMGYHWIVARPMLSDGQYVFFLIVTVPSGAAAAVSLGVMALARRRNPDLAAQAGIAGGLVTLGPAMFYTLMTASNTAAGGVLDGILGGVFGLAPVFAVGVALVGVGAAIARAKRWPTSRRVQ